MNSPIITVSQLIRYTKALLDEQKALGDVLLSGEINDLAFRSFNGHLYFTVTDGTSTIKCVMFSRYASALKKDLLKGDKVIVRGSVSIYEKDGTVQMIAYDIQQMGKGIKKNTLDDLKKKLLAEGLFSEERKKPFVQNPKAIGVITSPEGAALQDIIATMAIRNPLVKIIVYPAVMQGEKSAQSIIRALDFAESESLCDNYIIARGGGSSDDLGSFNDEILARRVSSFKAPIVSAVGHEIDVTILDLVSDARAATPTAACRLVCSSVEEYKRLIKSDVNILTDQVMEKCQLMEADVRFLQNRLRSMSVEARLSASEEKARMLRKSLDYIAETRTKNAQQRVSMLIDKLDILNPLNILKKGYTVTKDKDNKIADFSSLISDDIIITKFTDGEVKSRVISKSLKEDLS